jgi:formylmethanofuran dehydrogenase subunit B
MTLQIIENATCTFCGCVCDDINLHHDEVRIHKAERACVLGTSWFLNHTAEKKYPMALVDGQEATLDEAIAAAARFLHEADMPLIYGMSNTARRKKNAWRWRISWAGCSIATRPSDTGPPRSPPSWVAK